MTLSEDLLSELNEHCETAERLNEIGRLVSELRNEKRLTEDEYAAIVEAGKFRRYVVTTETPW